MSHPTQSVDEHVWCTHDMFGIHLHIGDRRFFIPIDQAEQAAIELLRRLIVVGNDQDFRITHALSALRSAKNG